MLFEAGGGHAMFVAVRLLEVFGFWVVWGCDGGGGVDPSDGEGVRHPKGESRDVGVDVGAWRNVDSFGEVEGDSAGLAGESFDDEGGGASFEGEVEVYEAEEAGCAVEEPENANGGDPGLLGETVDIDVDVDSEEGEECCELMEVDECLVESVSDG